MAVHDARIPRMILYAITSRVLLAEGEAERSEQLVGLAKDWAANGVDFIQIREGDLSRADLLRLAAEMVRAAHRGGDRTKVLINAAPEITLQLALDSGADGVHLPGGQTPDQLTETVVQIRESWKSGESPPISVSCHSVAEIHAARAADASLAIFAPVFEKVLPGADAVPGTGLDALAAACRAGREEAPYPELPVLALGGITLENASQCVAAGAAGIAAIRLFLDGGRMLLNARPASPVGL
jgi:thiamine-phosphate pyrophosphorylase